MHTILSLVTVPGHVSLVSTPITEELCNRRIGKCKDERQGYSLWLPGVYSHKKHVAMTMLYYDICNLTTVNKKR